MVSYIADTLSYNNDFCKLFTEIKNINVAVNRVNIILNFDDRKRLNIGDIDKTDTNGEIDFIDVYYNKDLDNNNAEFKLQNLNDVSFHIDNNECVLFKGERGCGKRTIFYLLRRMAEVNSGEIYVGRTTLREYSKNGQIEKINYVTTKPYFFKDTIKANLKLVNNSDDEIYNACRIAGVYDNIIKLEKGFDSPIELLSQRDKYLLSVARILLMNSQIVVFYEIPSYLSKDDEIVLKNIIDVIRINHTVLIFSATNKCDNIADKIYRVVNGSVKREKDNTSNKKYSLFEMLEDYEQSSQFSKFTKRKNLSTILKRYATDNIDEYDSIE